MKATFWAFGLALVWLLSGCGSSYSGYKRAPYSIKGIRYTPMTVEQALRFREEGIASWYDERRLFGLLSGTTAIGEDFRAGRLAGAHKTLPLPCRVRVTNLENGKATTIRVNDRGPFIANRILDVTPEVAERLDFKKQGLVRVRLEVLSVGDGEFRRSAFQERRFWFF
ncbi:MAG: septal ring lytic transglycosylase RlpA family protein [Verrucomicrobiota bacterium]